MAESADVLSGAAAPRFVVTVGTDHHQFDRLIEWVNHWLAGNRGRAAEFFVQSGSARVSPACPGNRFLEAEQLERLLDGADVIICHGGPGSIADAWERGRTPIVVPRLRRLGEVVDDHQVDFCRKLADLHRVRLAEDLATLTGLIDEAAAAPDRFAATGERADIAAAVARFGELVDQLVSSPPRRRGRRSDRKSPGQAMPPGRASSETGEPAPIQRVAVPQEELT